MFYVCMVNDTVTCEMKHGTINSDAIGNANAYYGIEANQ